MSNVLDISKEWQSAASMIEAHNAAIKEAIALIPQLGKAYTLPTQAVDATAVATSKLEQAEQKRAKAARLTEAQIEKNRLAELKLQKAREDAFDKYERQLQREQQKLAAASNTYNKVQAKLNALSFEYKDLATRKEIMGSLDDKEQKRYDFLAAKIQKYDQTLKAVDASMGKYQRNVGNYASAFNPLSHTFQQLTREAPAFANSLQTGFMAISNNLPMFFDAISQTRDEIKRLRASGEQVPGLFSQLTSSILSWGTALSVGVTLLTIYGKDIVEWGASLLKAKDGIDAVKESQKQLSEISLQGRKNAVEEQLQLKTLLAVAKDTSLSYRDRMTAVKELQDTYPAYLGNLSKEKILAGETAKEEAKLTQAILSRAKANAATEKITENQRKIIDLEETKIQLSKDLANAKANEARAIAYANKSTSEAAAYGAVSGVSDRIVVQKKIAKAQREINDLQEVNNRLTAYAIEFTKESIGLDYKAEKAKKDKNKAEKDAYDPSSLKAMEEMISALEEQLKGTELTSESYAFLNNILQAVKKSYEALISAMQPKETINLHTKGVVDLVDEEKNLQESVKAVTDELERQNEEHLKQQKALEDVKIATEKYIKGLAQAKESMGLDALGLSSLKFFTELDENGKSTFDRLMAGADTFKEKFAITFNAVADVAKEAYAMITASSNARFDEERARLEEQYKFQLQFANGNATAEAELANQLEAKKREIANREAKAKKQQAIFNILLNTAQGITAALASVPPNPILAGIIGAIGAAQLAFASSAKVPQYFKGRKGGKRELAWTDERGAELRVGKDGTIKDFGSNKGPRLQMLDEGDSIYTAEESTRILSQMRTPKREASGQTIVYKPVEMEKTEINIDRNGITGFIKRQASSAEIMNRHIQIKKYNV